MDMVSPKTTLGCLDGLVAAEARLSLASVMGVSQLILHGEKAQVSKSQVIIEKNILNARKVHCLVPVFF